MAANDTKALIDKLSAEDEDSILETLELLKDKGNENIVTPLLDLLLTEPAYSVTLGITDLLGNMRDKPSIDSFLRVFTEKRYTLIQHHLLSILWNSSFAARANQHVLSVVSMGINGTYLTLIEALTVIESLEPPFDEEQLLESISLCKAFIAANPKHEKLPLVKDVLTILSDMDNMNSEVGTEDLD